MTQLWKNGESLTLGKYWLNSNLWGAETGSGSQCLWETSQALNLSEFFDSLVERGLSRSTYLISVEAGVEVFTGAGRLDTTAYAVDIGEASPIR